MIIFSLIHSHLTVVADEQHFISEKEILRNKINQREIKKIEKLK